MEETQFIQCFQQGNLKISEQLFAALYDKYALKAVRTAYLITGNRQLAEDILQETFLQCYTQLHTLKEPDKFQSWFYKILVRLCWRFHSREKVKFKSEPFDEFLGRQANGSANVEERLETSEEYVKLNQTIQQLSNPLREAIILYYFNDLSVKEIAEILGCFENTVKTRLYKARKKLRIEIEKFYGSQEKGVEVYG